MQPELNFGFVVLPTYFVVLSLLMTGLVFIGYKKALSESQSILLTMNLAMIIMIFGFIGARLFHIFYEAPALYLQNPVLIFHFWLGGYVFYGGALAAFFSCWLYLRSKHENWKIWADFLTPLIALGVGWGRLSCFFAGCCYGTVCSLPWGVRFQDAFLRHPTQLYQLILETVFAVLTYKLGQTKSYRLHPGQLFFTYLCLHGLGRAFVETFRDDFRGPMLLGFGVSFWIGLMISAIGFSFLTLKRDRAQK